MLPIYKMDHVSRAAKIIALSSAIIVGASPGVVAHARARSSDLKIETEVSKALFTSGQQANNALNQLSAERAAAGAPTAKIPAVDPSKAPPALRRQITLTWNGRADHLVKKIASSVGYAYRVVGPRPAAPVVVTMVFRKMPAVDVLQQVGIRINHSAQISVDTASRTVTYRRVRATSGISGALVGPSGDAK